MKEEVRTSSPGRYSPNSIVTFPRIDSQIPNPIFGSDRWDLSSIQPNLNRSKFILDFQRFEKPFKQIAKEITALQLEGVVRPLHPYGVQVPLTRPSVYSSQLSAMNFAFEFMQQETIGALSELTQEHLDLYLAQLRATKMSGLGMAMRLRVFQRFYECREHLTGGGLSFRPFEGRNLNHVVGYRQPEENLTPRIPEDVLKGIIGWALAYVDDFSADIMHGLSSARTMVAEADEVRPSITKETLPNLMRYLEDCARHGRPVPARRRKDGRLTIHFEKVSQYLGVSVDSIYKGEARALLAKWEPRLRLEHYTPILTNYVPVGSSVTWREAMSENEIYQEHANLVLAAYLITSAFSGMRDSEVQGLMRDCVMPVSNEHGEIVRYRVSGRKIKRTLAGEEQTWTVIEPVARALGVLQKLSDMHAATPHLFVRRAFANQELTLFKQFINAELRSFLDHCNGLADRIAKNRSAEKDAPQPTLTRIPDGPDGPWHLTTSQFRRTLAWFIINRPYGVAAAGVQFGHIGVQVTEGYGGASNSGFQDEIDAEKVTAYVGRLEDHFAESRRDILPAGPMGQALSEVFDDIAAELEALADDIEVFPGQVVYERELHALLRHTASKMRVGLYADCYFEPSQARCLEHLAPDARHEPVVGLCDPDCPRACWTKNHLPAWERQRDEAREYSRLNRVSPLQRKLLAQDEEYATRKIEAIRRARNELP